MTIVFSLGGSVFNDKKIAQKYVTFFENLAKTQQVGVVVGGGKLARKRITSIKRKGASEALQHMAGITATRDNAQKLCDMLKSSNKVVCETFEEALEASFLNQIVVMGGTIPYVTSDTSTIVLADLLNAKKIINLSNVDYLYDKDPNKFKTAKKILKMNKTDFLEFVLKNDKRKPGEHFIVDLVAAFILEKVKAPLYIINGKNLNEVKNAISGKKFKGTVIK